MNLRTIASLLALSLSLTAACAPVDGLDEAATQEADAVVLREGVTVDARYRFVYTTTPTYGSQPDAVLTVTVSVNDATVRRANPGFNGFEAPFVRIPRAENGRVLWESVALRYVGTSPTGYYGQERLDRYELASARRIDLPTVQRLGVAVGMETNVGSLWAQSPDRNHPVRPADAR